MRGALHSWVATYLSPLSEAYRLASKWGRETEKPPWMDWVTVYFTCCQWRDVFKHINPQLSLHHSQVCIYAILMPYWKTLSSQTLPCLQDKYKSSHLVLPSAAPLEIYHWRTSWSFLAPDGWKCINLLSIFQAMLFITSTNNKKIYLISDII